MRIYVTGAGGFVGRRLVPMLKSEGHDVVGADREVDVTLLDSISPALRDHAAEAVIHLAAMSSVAESWRRPQECFRRNFVGTRTLLEAVESTCPEARVLLIGSADQYAPTSPQGCALTEDTPLRPRSPYARSKAAGEQLGFAASQRGLNVVRVRAFNHTGAGQADAFVVSSFARQVAAIHDGRQNPIMRVGNLESVRDFLHVDDVLRAYAALLRSDVKATVYNIASGEATPIQTVLDRLLSIAGVEARIERDPDRYRPTDWLVGDATRLRDATGWQPQVEFDSLLGELYEDWAQRDAE